MREVELKLDIAPRDIALLPPILGPASKTQPMLALYFDTPDEILRTNGMALRLRREGGRWVQTLKGGGHVAAGLHARDEYEFESADGALDLARFRDSPLAALPGANILHERLAVAFEVRLERTTWQVQPAPGVALEVAFDRGAVRRGSASDAVCELEIESKAGPDGAVFDFARTLLERVSLVPSSVTKAQRGYRLASGQGPKAAHGEAVNLHARMSVGEAAAAVLGAALAQLVANMEAVLASGDPECVHQLRVALRRTRSALRVFRRVLGKPLVRALREPLRQVTTLAGRVRDLDVLATRTLPAMHKAKVDTAAGERRDAMLARARHRAHRSLVRQLRSPGFARVLLDLAQAVHRPPAPGGRRLKRFIAARLCRIERPLLDAEAPLGEMDEATRHRLRVRAKRLRYAMESSSALFAHGAVKRYGERLSELQDALGDANDLRVARELLRGMPGLTRNMRAARTWLEQNETAAVQRAGPLLDRLRRKPSPWRKH